MSSSSAPSLYDEKFDDSDSFMRFRLSCFRVNIQNCFSDFTQRRQDAKGGAETVRNSVRCVWDGWLTASTRGQPSDFAEHSRIHSFFFLFCSHRRVHFLLDVGLPGCHGRRAWKSPEQGIFFRCPCHPMSLVRTAATGSRLR